MKKQVYLLSTLGVILIAVGLFILIPHFLAVEKAGGTLSLNKSDSLWFDPSFVGFIPFGFGAIFIMLAIYAWHKYTLKPFEPTKKTKTKTISHRHLSDEEQRIWSLHASLISPGMRH